MTAPPFLGRILAVLVKEFTQLRRDRLTYAMMLLMPVIQLLLFGYAINNDPKHLPTAVFVQDRSVLARSTLSAMANTGYYRIVRVARSQGELDEAIRHGEAQIAVTIPADFSRRVIRRDRPQILVEADAADPTATGGALAPGRRAGGCWATRLPSPGLDATQPSTCSSRKAAITVLRLTPSCAARVR